MALKMIPESTIARAQQHWDSRVAAGLTEQEVEACGNQDDWLAALRKYFSIAIACRITGIGYATTLKWRSRYPEFGRRYNQFVSALHEELLVSVYHRALGFYKKEQGTDSGYAEDGQGIPIRFAGDTQLAINLLRAGDPEQFGKGGDDAPLTITIDSRVLVGTDGETTRFAAATPIEGEAVLVNDDDPRQLTVERGDPSIIDNKE